MKSRSTIVTMWWVGTWHLKGFPSSKIWGRNGSWRLVRTNLSTGPTLKTRWHQVRAGTSTPLTMAGTVALACPLFTIFSVFQLSVAGCSSVSWTKTDQKIQIGARFQKIRKKSERQGSTSDAYSDGLLKDLKVDPLLICQLQRLWMQHQKDLSIGPLKSRCLQSILKYREIYGNIRK